MFCLPHFRATRLSLGQEAKNKQTPMMCARRTMQMSTNQFTQHFDAREMASEGTTICRALAGSATAKLNTSSALEPLRLLLGPLSFNKSSSKVYPCGNVRSSDSRWPSTCNQFTWLVCSVRIQWLESDYNLPDTLVGSW
jgi:hypothetical protein